MAGQLPSGESVPSDGSLPSEALGDVLTRPFGLYVHVPFCRVRCGYCDFNTYTPGEVGGGEAHRRFVAAIVAELDLAASTLRGRDSSGGLPEVSTVFVGGGTPTLLAPALLGEILTAVRSTFPTAADLEVTVEANPETVVPGVLASLHDYGYTRISLGMQSTRPHVLAVLDRVHSPGAAPAAAIAARTAGFSHVSLDLIYGTPGESDDDWRASLDAALCAEPDHLSAYALVVEQGTALARRVRSGLVAAVDDDVLAARYEIADERLGSAGLHWYEVSNWARTPGDVCRHNLLYWRSDNWWGVGPGAHSHVGGVRWWNERRPETYAGRLEAGVTPAAGREVLDAPTRAREDAMLRLRLADGIAVHDVGVGPGTPGPHGLPGSPVPPERPGLRPALAEWVAEQCRLGVVDPAAADEGRIVLTLRGRLLADGVVASLWEVLDSDVHWHSSPESASPRT